MNEVARIFYIELSEVSKCISWLKENWKGYFFLSEYPINDQDGIVIGNDAFGDELIKRITTYREAHKINFYHKHIKHCSILYLFDCTDKKFAELNEHFTVHQSNEPARIMKTKWVKGFNNAFTHKYAYFNRNKDYWMKLDGK